MSVPRGACAVWVSGHQPLAEEDRAVLRTSVQCHMLPLGWACTRVVVRLLGSLLFAGTVFFAPQLVG